MVLLLIVMVNNVLRDQRKNRIAEVLKILKEINKNKKELNKAEFIMQICVKYEVQQRKASEYLKVAQYMLDNKQ